MSERSHQHFGELPHAWLADQRTNYEQLVACVRRRNPKGQLATVYRVTFPVASLASLDEWLRTRAGGGNYFVEFSDPDDPGPILATCEFRVEGAVRPPLPIEHEGKEPPIHIPGPVLSMLEGFGPDEVDLADSVPPEFLPPQADPEPHEDSLPFDPTLPEAPMTTAPAHPAPTTPASAKWASGLPPAEAASFGVRPAVAPRMATGIATIASDQIEREARARAEEKAARLEEKLARVLEVASERERTLEQTVNNLRLESERREHDAKMRFLEDKIAVLSTQIASGGAAAASKPTSLAEIATLVAAAAPILTAVLPGSRESQAQTLQMITALATKDPGPTIDPLAAGEKMVSMLMPFIAQAQNKGPGIDVDLIRTMGEMQMQQAGMTANLLGVLAESNVPEPAKPFFQQMIDNMPAIAAGMEAFGSMIAKGAAGAAASAGPARLPAPVPHRPVQQTAQPATAQGFAPAPQTIVATQPGTSAPTTEATQTPRSRFHVEGDSEAEIVQAQAPGAAEVVSAQVPPPADVPADPMTATPVELDIEKMLPFLPEAFRTKPWRGWIRSLHRGDPADEVGETLATLLSRLDEGDLPDDAMEAISSDTAGYLERMGMLTPMGQAHPGYMQLVVAYAVEALRVMGNDEEGE